MLPSYARLSRSEFENILKNKDILVVYNKLGTLKYLKSSSKKVAVVTSSKHSKSAVVRNKARRRIYTLFGQVQNPIQGVVYVAKSSYTLSFDETKQLFLDLIAKTAK